MAAKEFNTAVVVARFQGASLHMGHRHLLAKAHDLANEVVVILGESPLRSTSENPLCFYSRRRMVREIWPTIKAFPLADGPCNTDWSRRLDSLVEKVCNPSVVLVGGRDSFLKGYNGMYPTHKIESIRGFSATNDRKAVRLDYPRTRDERRGAVWATGRERQWHELNAKMCVDMLLLRNGCFLMGTKPGDPRLRLPGGFVDNGETLETAAQREIREETGLILDIRSSHYQGSHIVSDWRYKPLGMKITTAAFMVTVPYDQEPEPGDDLDSVKWVPFDLIPEFEDSEIVPGHQELIRKVMNW